MGIMTNDILSYFKLEVEPDRLTQERACPLLHLMLSSTGKAVTTITQNEHSGSIGEAVITKI